MFCLHMFCFVFVLFMYVLFCSVCLFVCYRKYHDYSHDKSDPHKKQVAAALLSPEEFMEWYDY